jgi:L-ribulokinase
VTAPAAQAIEPGRMLIVMGTSNCHVVNGDTLAEVPGMCGVVDGGIVPGLWGYEAGQSGVGDIFAWFTDNAVPPRYHDQALARELDLHSYLSALAGEQEPGAHGLVALDWLSGNRSVLVDHELSGLIVGMTLATRAEDVYRALIEATAFGTRTILDAFADAGVPVTDLCVAGGLVKNPVVMQIYADVTRMRLNVIASDQGPAVGSAMHAAVAAGLHPDIQSAAAAMGGARRDAYVPDAAAADVYDVLYEHYRRLHDHFGRGGDDVMHALRHIRPRELAHG